MDPLTSVIVSVGIVPLLREYVQYLKPTVDDNVPKRYRKLAYAGVSLVFGVLISIAWDVVNGVGQPLAYTISLGFLSGVLASVYHDVKKSSK